MQTSGQRYGVKLEGSEFRPGAAWQAKGWSVVSLVWATLSRRQGVLQGWTLRCSIDAILAAGGLFCKLAMHTGTSCQHHTCVVVSRLWLAALCGQGMWTHLQLLGQRL